MNVQEMQRNFMIKLRQFVEEPEVESEDIEYYLNRAQESFVKEQHFIIRDNYRNQQVGNISVQRAIENLRTLVNTVEETPNPYFRISNAIYIDLSRDGYSDSSATLTADVASGDTTIAVSLGEQFNEGDALYVDKSNVKTFLGTVSSISFSTGTSGAATITLLGSASTSANSAESIYISQPFTGYPYAYYLRSQVELSSGGTLNCRVIDPTMISKFTKTKYNLPLFREPAVLIEGDFLIAIYPSEVSFDQISSLELTYITNPSPVSIAGNITSILPAHTHNEIVDQAVEFKIQDLQRARALGIDKDVQAPPMQQQRRGE